MSSVLLVSMPFGNLFAPSLGLALLQAGLAHHGVACRVRYFTLPFARRVGRAFYSAVAEDVAPSARHLPGEWVFARAAFGPRSADEQRYLESLRDPRSGWIAPRRQAPVTAARMAGLLRARDQAEDFLDHCARELLEERPRIVGFTSVFQQHVASLALAARLKRAAPETFVVFGGSNCEGPMGAETVRQFACVDAVVSGEGDQVFPELVRRVLQGGTLDGLSGVRTRASVARDFAAGRFANAPVVTDLDALPEPDYGDYFEEFRRSGYAREWQARIFFESSRGCWWGQKQHCTFCGLNGQTMAYRSKSPRRAVDELTRLAARHPGCDVQVVDNILDMRYFDSVLPELAARRPRLELFYETKSNLRKEHVRRLHAAGVRSIQPGIESFSDSVLALMRKGVSGLQNVQLLKWCRELGVKPYWNVLWGFPGEDPEEYARLARLVPLLTHLEPPVACERIRLDRFSPNFFDAERLGLVDVEPLPAYHAVYPLPPEALANLAYHFVFRYGDGRDPHDYVQGLLRAVKAWRARHAGSDLFVADGGRHAVVCDLRPGAAEALIVLDAVEAALYRACDGVAELRQLADQAGLDAKQVELRLEPLVARGLLLRQGTRYLGLALPLGEYAPNPSVVKRFCSLVRHLGHARKSGIALRLRPASDARTLRVADVPARAGAARPRLQARDVGRLEARQFRVDDNRLVLRLERPRVP